jgi:hypothetical protein
MSVVTSVFVVAVISSIVSIAGVIGAGFLAAGLALPAPVRWRARAGDRRQFNASAALAPIPIVPAGSGTSAPRPAIAGAAAAASLSRRETRFLELAAQSGQSSARQPSADPAYSSGRIRRRPSHPHHATNARRS